MARPLSVAIADHVVDWQRVPWPAPWAEIFSRRAPLALEIGFGNGAFLADEAERRPDRDHVGIELSWTAATHLFRRLARSGATNVRVLLGDAEALVRHLFGPGTLSDVIVNHPCPWPKARHHARRLLRRDVLAMIAERMQPGAELTVLTDHAEYAEWLAGELAAVPALASCHATAEVPSIPGRMATKYQLKAMAEGIPIHCFQWRRVGPPSATARDEVQEVRMPTMTLTGAPEDAELLRGFVPQLFRERHQDVEIVVRLETVYRQVESRAWLVETLVQEGRLAQTFAVEVVARGGDVLVKPSEIGKPYPTHGVKRAIWCMGKWLQARFEGMEVRRESLGID